MTDGEPTDLLGTWRFARELRDHDEGCGSAVGTLELVEVDGTVSWDETGTLSWNGNHVEISRHMQLQRDADGWAVHFADGGLFHTWSPGVGVVHLCGQDTYEGLVELAPDQASLTITWSVHGPKKNQRIRTRYERDHPSG